MTPTTATLTTKLNYYPYSHCPCVPDITRSRMWRVGLRRLAAKEPRRLTYVRNLPWYAQNEKVPIQWKVFGTACIVPLWAGGLAVHLLPLRETPESEANDASRQVLGWTMHYASVLVGVQTALHWGMQSINLGLPTHTVEFTPLYRFMRFGLPVIPLTVAVLASRLSVDNPRAAAVVLMCVQAVATGADVFAYAFATCPVWFTRYHWNLSLGIFGGLLALMLSERMKLRGELNLITER